MFGRLFLEMVFGRLPALPGPGEEVYADEFGISCGGAITVAAAAREAGATVGLVTAVGSDLGSRVVEEHCQSAGIDLGAARRLDQETCCVSVALNFDGDRAFVSHCPTGSWRPSERDIAGWASTVRRERASWVHLHAGPGVADVLRAAHRVGSHTMLDVNLETIRSQHDDLLECVGLADVFVPNEQELLLFSGAKDVSSGLESLPARPRVVVVKRGAKGVVLLDARGVQSEVTAGLVDVKAVDRTGAGDSFSGAMVGTLARGGSLQKALEAGNFAGSRAVTRLGGLGRICGTGIFG